MFDSLDVTICRFMPNSVGRRNDKTNIRWYRGRPSDILTREDNIYLALRARSILTSRVNIALHLSPYHVIFVQYFNL